MKRLDRLRHELERAARQALSPGAEWLPWKNYNNKGGPGRGSRTRLAGSGPRERPFWAGAQTPGPSCPDLP